MQKNVLVIDNDPVAGEMIVAVLQGEGYGAVAAASFGEGLQKARMNLPDLFILDLVMPDNTGFEGCRQIKKLFQPRPPKVIVMTGKSTMTDLMRSRTVGVDDFLVKTSDMANLVQGVRKVFSA